jgi:hypothetical protein
MARISPPPRFELGARVVFATADQRYPGVLRVARVEVSYHRGQEHRVLHVTWGGVAVGAFLEWVFRPVSVRRATFEVTPEIARRVTNGMGWTVGEWVRWSAPELGVAFDGLLAQITTVRRGRARIDLLEGGSFDAFGRGSLKGHSIDPFEANEPRALAHAAVRERRDLEATEARGDVPQRTAWVRRTLERRTPERRAMLEALGAAHLERTAEVVGAWSKAHALAASQD